MSEETFLQRWSRLKAERRRAEAEPVAPLETEDAGENVPVPAGGGVPEDAAEEKPQPELPPIESLTAESDYTAFMQPDVPEEMRLAALRKLWTSDPVLSAMDPLDHQNFDFTFPTVPEVVRTAYQVGKGFLDAAEKLAEAEDAPRETPPATKES